MGLDEEYHEKRRRVAELMERHQLGGLVLGRNSGVSWALCGGEAHVATNAEEAVATVVFTPHGDYLLASEIEIGRLQAEELRQLPLQPVSYPWYQPARRDALVSELVGGARFGADVALAGGTSMAAACAALRASLTPEEQERLRQLGAAAGVAICTAAGEISPGMDELQVAGLLAEECYLRDIAPVVLLVAADERIRSFRHPIPTEHKVQRSALLVLCARRHGMIVSVSRLLHFGRINADLRARMRACATVDAEAHAATIPGTTLGAIFERLVSAYAAQGFANEWQLHHQGGPAGYENREALALPESRDVVQEYQAFAWNPSITGTKSEDTILVASGHYEVVTGTSSWPLIEVEAGGRVFSRPAILEVE